MEGIDESTGESSQDISQSVDELDDETRSVPSDEKYVIISPNWPNEVWESKREQDVKNKPDSKHLHYSENSRSSVPGIDHVDNSGLARFLKVFDEDLKVLEQEQSKAIKHEVTTMIEGTVQRLMKCQPIFQTCRLIPAGSVAEGTKIGEMNEFDFLLVLDIFSDKELFEVRLHKTHMLILLENGKESEKLLAANPRMGEPLHDSKKMRLKDIRSELMDIFMDDFLSNMLPGWTFWTPEEKVCFSDIATTLHLTSQKHKMDVDVDVCLCIPVSKEDCVQATKSEQKVDDSVAYFTYIINLVQEIAKEEDLEIFAIIGEFIFSRITLPLLESAPFRASHSKDGRLQTYQYAKCIASCFLPKRTKLFGCDRCCHSLVKSYDLKNIVLFMIKNYTDDEFWTPDKVCCRLVEVFGFLQNCIPEKGTEQVATISTCCTPGSIRIEYISTYNQFIDSRDEKSDLLFTPDSHKPRYGLRSPPEYKESIETDVPDIDKAVMDYFDHLNSEHWDSYELIDRMSKLFTYLHSLKGDTLYT